MFAVRKIVTIVPKKIYSIQFEGESSDSFHLLFDRWNDISWLYMFFNDQRHHELLKNYFYTSSIDAIKYTIELAGEMEKRIYNAAKGIGNEKLSDLFKPLSKKERTPYPRMKIYGPDYARWLRVYGIKIDEDLYIITGGGIKLTKKMQQSPFLEEQLERLKVAKEYLKSNGITSFDDIEWIL